MGALSWKRAQRVWTESGQITIYNEFNKSSNTYYIPTCCLLLYTHCFHKSCFFPGESLFICSALLQEIYRSHTSICCGFPGGSIYLGSKGPMKYKCMAPSVEPFQLLHCSFILSSSPSDPLSLTFTQGRVKWVEKEIFCMLLSNPFHKLSMHWEK